MKETTVKLISYAREFLSSAKRDLDIGSNFCLMQAVLKSHDAVEFGLRAIANERNIALDPNVPIPGLMKAIKNGVQDKSLPLVHQMTVLNDARRNVKHDASIPSLDDARKCHLYADEFLLLVTPDFFGIEFHSFSQTKLIENVNIRKYLEMAEAQIAQGDYLEAVISVKKAFIIARPANDLFVHTSQWRHVTFLFADDFIPQKVRETLEEMAGTINELQTEVAAVMMGIDGLALRRFNEITPRFVFLANGGCFIDWEGEPTREVAQEAVEFVLDTILSWQRMGVVAGMPEKSSLTRRQSSLESHERREDWSPWQERLSQTSSND